MLPELPDRDSFRAFLSVIVLEASKLEMADAMLKDSISDGSGGSGSGAAGGSGSGAAGGGDGGGAEVMFSLVFEAITPMVPTAPAPAAIV